MLVEQGLEDSHCKEPAVGWRPRQVALHPDAKLSRTLSRMIAMHKRIQSAHLQDLEGNTAAAEQ
jgi:predicted N-acyltransferase